MPTARSGLQKVFKTFGKAVILISITTLLVLAGCGKSSSTEQLSEGTIQYDIKYTNNSGRNFPVQLLPKVMDLTFNQNFAAYGIEDRVGLFAIKIIMDLKQHRHLTLIKVFDKKYVYRSTDKETPILFKPDIKYTLMDKADTTRICGYLCYKINLSVPPTDSIIPITYTTVNIKTPNYNTPYSNVEGLLMVFNLQMKSLDMKLVAKNIEQKVVNDKDFDIPKGYKLISRAKMEEIITTLLP